MGSGASKPPDTASTPVELKKNEVTEESLKSKVEALQEELVEIKENIEILFNSLN